jgi:hypothetical protein
MNVEQLEPRLLMAGDGFADEVLYYRQGPGVVRLKANPDNALGAPDEVAVSLGENGQLALLFVDEVVVDGPGWDISFEENGSGDSGFLFVSDDGGQTWHYAAGFDGSQLVDLSNADRRTANAVLVVDMPPSRGNEQSAGVDVDSIWARYTEESPFPPGDSNLDRRFDQFDLIKVLQAGKYMTGERATWSEGDWNRDGVFSQQDISLALASDRYMADE